MSKKLVAYFSAERGITRNAAELVAAATGADLFEIVPQQPYTAEDLYWPNNQCRSVVETKDQSTRPKIAVSCNNICEYDIVFLGFPIWCAIAPTIINTFLESYDFSGKTIVPFATSGGSGYGPANNTIITSAPGAKVLLGTMLTHASKSKVEKWVESLNL